ncbi:hypothetical protein Q4Q34_06805 [Flavivirga abyssicola]|uniref:hypothetical protein n=1 Tax=Flavivirga abyssicola TaxID=3063533 RepID=UPI0026E0E33C|nr:hypothetical protein [Flavivirga sp. MEBiC07777]WVK14737.1 hypothetical protein Q4Q34_06805 [Flavivirga sp. MEBiC07777]
MNGQIIGGILIMILGTGLGTYFIQKGRTKLAFENSKKIIKHLNSLDSASRAEIINNSNLNKDEIIYLVNHQTKSSAIEIIEEVSNKFGIINNDLVEKEKKINELEKKETERKNKQKAFEKLKNTPPLVDFYLENRDNKLFIKMTFKNNVPIMIRPYLSVIWDSKEKNHKTAGWKAYTGFSEIHPDENGIAYFEYDSLNNKNLPIGKEVLGFRVIIRYYSIYYPEIKDEKLGERTLELNLGLDPNDNKFKNITG